MSYNKEIQRQAFMAQQFRFDYTIDRSGIGDYLIALNHALTISEWLGLPVAALPNRLNERTGSNQIYSYLGLDKISAPPPLPPSLQTLQTLKIVIMNHHCLSIE